MTNPFNEEDIKDIHEMIQKLRDRRAWGRLSQHVKSIAMYLMAMGAFFAFIKEPLFRIMGWDV